VYVSFGAIWSQRNYTLKIDNVDVAIKCESGGWYTTSFYGYVKKGSVLTIDSAALPVFFKIYGLTRK